MVLKRKIASMDYEHYWYDEIGYYSSKASIAALRTDKPVSLFDCLIPERTLRIELCKEEKDIFASFDCRARHSIKSFERVGRVKLASTPDEQNKFYNKYIPFAASRGLLIPCQAEETQLDIFLAYSHLGELVHAAAFLPLVKQQLYIYRYSVTVVKSQANAAIIWSALKHAKTGGFNIFDLGGISRRSNPTPKWRSIAFFKRQFGASAVDTFFYLKGGKLLYKLLLTIADKMLKSEMLYQFATSLATIFTQKTKSFSLFVKNRGSQQVI